MTAESVGNFICAATRNDCNAKADAGTSCCNPTSLWRQDGGTRSSCFSLPVLLDSRFRSHSKFWVLWRSKKNKQKTQSIGGSVREGSCKRLGWKPPELCAVLGVWLWVWWANGKTSSPQSVCASSCSSGMAANKQQHSMVSILLLAPLQLVIVWLGNARNWGWIHEQNYTQSDTNTPTQR